MSLTGLWRALGFNEWISLIGCFGAGDNQSSPSSIISDLDNTKKRIPKILTPQSLFNPVTLSFPIVSLETLTIYHLLNKALICLRSYQ